jgi:pSer/pThr/pTyr-binding forkhead associated (FHA) protein
VADSSLVIHEGAGAGSEHPVHGELILGREQRTADLVLDDPGVSRRHARVLPDQDGVVVEDLGSSNGTYVNGQRISGPVELGAGDELQVGSTVVGVHRAALTAPMPAPSQRGPVPRRLAPHPHAESNIPALVAVFLGPLSILLVILSAGGFFIALPCGIAAIILGSIGIRNADRRQSGHRRLARIGRFTGFLGTFLAVLAVIVFVVVAAALHSAETSVGGLVNRIRDEVNKVDVPSDRQAAPSRSEGRSP